MKCNGDCFNCIYPDCINDYVKPYDAEYHKKYKKEHREQQNKRKRELRAERKASGICVECGKRPIAENSETRCIDCLLKFKRRDEEHRRKKGSLPRELFDGVNLCQKCGKDRPVDGYKLCKSCLEKNRQSIAIGRTMRKNETFRKNIDGFWIEKKAKKLNSGEKK